MMRQHERERKKERERGDKGGGDPPKSEQEIKLAVSIHSSQITPPS
jgi:hypothetical protein